MHLRSLADLPEEPVSHNPLVRKRVWVRNGEAGCLTQVSRAVFPPGEVCPAHSHTDMWEMFLVEQGVATFGLDGETRECPSGDCLVLAPGERHEVANRAGEELVMLTIGWKQSGH